jgi:polyphosphate kinase
VLDLGDLMAIANLDLPELRDPPLAPTVPAELKDATRSMVDVIRERDVLVHHPFDSFTASVERFLEEAASDDQVLAIKLTLYRTSGDTAIVRALTEAAQQGKQVAVLVELKARFDERNNILWARRLEAHGVHVVYGFADLKTHSKLCLVVRKEAGGIRRYAHIGSGNYNPTTAKIYTDVGLFTADDEIVADVSEVFNYLTGYSSQREFRRLLVAPVQLRAKLGELVAREAEHARAGRPSGIIVKVNAVTDDLMIRELYKASQAGVPIDLIVRGICCLRPGVPGVSETIRVRSVVGRFLEHSRLYFFENGGEAEIYLGSADLMERNLDRRVEALTPVRDPEIRRHLRDVVLDAYLRDTDRATELAADGRYRRPAAQSGAERFNAQRFLLDSYSEARSL